MTRYAQWRARIACRWPWSGSTGRAPTRSSTAGWRRARGTCPDQEETRELLGTYGIRPWRAIEVSDVEEAVAAAEELSYPVILKSISPVVRHQPGLTGVRADLGDADAVRDAHASLTERLGPLRADRFVVQRMAVPGCPVC